MTRRFSPNFSHLTLALLAIGCTALLLVTGGASAQALEPFPCTGEAFVVQDFDGKLFQVDQTRSPVEFQVVCPSLGIEVNAMGFRRSDGLLYAAHVDLAAGINHGIVRIGRNCQVDTPFTSLAEPPPDIGLNGGDVSTDGATMYVAWHDDPNLYSIDLTGLPLVPPTSSTPLLGSGIVLDWAYNPIDGKLYGGDRDGSGGAGEVARLDPTTGVRTDFRVAGLPAGAPTQYGGAWFNAAGRLFIYENRGTLYEIDLGPDLSAPTPTIFSIQSGPSSLRNDAAACIQDLVGAAKRMTVTSVPGVWPATVQLDFEFEAFHGVTFAWSALDDLTGVFGVHGVDWLLDPPIVSDRPGFENPSYDGHSDIQLINQDPSQDLAAGETATVTVEILLLTLDGGIPDALEPRSEYCNQVDASAESVHGVVFVDVSTDGPDPDPNGDGSPDEREPSCLTVPWQPDIELLKSGSFHDENGDGLAQPGESIGYTFQVSNTGNVTLTEVTIDDPVVTAISCPGGHPIASLGPGMTVLCTGSYAITQADVDAGEKVNTATVTARDPHGDPVSDQDGHTEPLPSEPCGPCLGKVSTLTLVYHGSVPSAFVEITGKFGSSQEPIFAGTVEPEVPFVVDGPEVSKFPGTLGTDIEVQVNGVLNAGFHTSCSQPIGPGQVSGDFEILAGESKEGGPLCPL